MTTCSQCGKTPHGNPHYLVIDTPAGIRFLVTCSNECSQEAIHTEGPAVTFDSAANHPPDRNHQTSMLILTRE